MSPRLVAAALAVIGLLLSFNVQDPPPRGSVERGGYYVLAADFHVHSFPGDGGLPPWEIAREAARRGLDVVALTNHNSMLSSAIPWPFPPGGALLIPSQELTAVGYHVAAVGIDGPVDWRGPVTKTAAEIHARGGVAIAAHPGRLFQPAFDAAAIAALDGVEAAHPMIHDEDDAREELVSFYERARHEHPGIAAIGSTDFHHFAPIGLCRTYLFAKSRMREGVMDALRAGRTVACDGRGATYGPPELAALVADDCRAAAGAPPIGATALDTISAVCVWLGLLGLVVLGAENS